MKPPREPDLLDLPLREVLARLATPSAPIEADPWVDPRACEAPFREVLAAGKRGELALFKVGRKYLVRRSELDRWLALPEHRVTACAEKKGESAAQHLLDRYGYRRVDRQGAKP